MAGEYRIVLADGTIHRDEITEFISDVTHCDAGRNCSRRRRMATHRMVAP
jgi:hypothetical protein